MNAMTLSRVSMCVLVIAAASMPSFAFAAEPPGVRGVVLRVLDANTLRVQTGSGRYGELIRLIGLDAPRKATRDTGGQEPWGTRAQQFSSLLVTRKEVRIEFDVVVQSEPGVRWGYVWVGDKLLNDELLRAGHALLDTRPPNVRYAERLAAAQREAREAGRNVWDAAEPLTEAPSKFAARKADNETTRAGVQATLELPAYEPGCVVANSKTKKYHAPGGRYYEQAKASAHAVYFKTTEDAKSAGYEPAAR